MFKPICCYYVLPEDAAWSLGLSWSVVKRARGRTQTACLGIVAMLMKRTIPRMTKCAFPRPVGLLSIATRRQGRPTTEAPWWPRHSPAIV